MSNTLHERLRMLARAAETESWQLDVNTYEGDDEEYFCLKGIEHMHDADGVEWMQKGDASLIAAMDPAFVLELADLLEYAAMWATGQQRRGFVERANALRDRLPEIESDRK